MTANKLTRVCASCGIEKPISAFLQLTGAQGTTYGSICATCRSRDARQAKTVIKDDSSSSTTGHRIGAKQKAFIDKELYRQLKESQELDKKERNKKDESIKEKTDKTITKEKSEKKHRQTFIEKSKTEFFNKGQFLTNRESKFKAALTEQERNTLTKAEQEISNLEFRKVATDFSALHHPLQGGRLELTGLPFLEFIDKVLGEQAPISKVLKQIYAKPKTTSQEKLSKPIQQQNEQETLNFMRRNMKKP